MFDIICNQFVSNKKKKYAIDFEFESSIEELLEKYVDKQEDLDIYVKNKNRLSPCVSAAYRLPSFRTIIQPLSYLSIWSYNYFLVYNKQGEKGLCAGV